MKWIVLGLVVTCACDKGKDATPGLTAPPAPTVPVAADLPDPHTVDWASLSYDLGSLGTVTATHGRAEFRVVEDELGYHAKQGSEQGTDWPGTLELDAPVYVDLDGNEHDEALIAFDLKEAQLEDAPHVFGVFVFTLRDGLPVKLATIKTSSKPGYTLVGPTIKTTEGVTWRWNASSATVTEVR